MSDQIGDCLLSMYECISDPIHFRSMTAVLTSWLADEQEELSVVNFEFHAKRVWDLLEDFLKLEVSKDSTPSLVTPSSVKANIPMESVLDFLNAEDVARLEDCVDRRSRRFGNSESLLVRLHRNEGKSSELALLEFDDDGTPILAIVADDFEQIISEFFAESFSLSAAEMQVVKELVQGGTLRDISAKLGKSVETLRVQIKSVTSKLGVASQLDVVRMSRQAAVLAQTSPGLVAQKPMPVDGAKQLSVGSGRVIEYNIDGPDNTRTLVFVHCLTEGRHWTRPAIDMAVSHGYKLIRYSRAGFGSSTVNKKTGMALLNDHLSDLQHVIKTEATGRIDIFAQSSGFAVAYAFALLHPDKVGKIVGINVSPPILRREDAECLKGIFKTGALANLYAPTAAKLVAKFAVRRLVTRGRDELDDPLVMPGINLKEVETEEGLDTYLKNTDDALKQRGEGYWREASYSNVDWSYAKPNANTRPSTVLLASSDCPFTHPGKIESFAKKIGADLVYVPTFLPMVSGPLPRVLSILQHGAAP
ncbi:alpha/beta fold hydrolase [Roseobacter sp. S98]|uniref:alpha/beta fold hydrolase n=1 Tax=Roseobacter algicola (ex Choi et al. 2025) (nom. illeg.) TaxID=3092138 RepID=UPI0035C68537